MTKVKKKPQRQVDKGIDLGSRIKDSLFSNPVL